MTLLLFWMTISMITDSSSTNSIKSDLVKFEIKMCFDYSEVRKKHSFLINELGARMIIFSFNTFFNTN